MGPGPCRRGRYRNDRDYSPIEVYQFSHDLDERTRSKQWVGMHFQRDDEALWGQTMQDKSEGASSRPGIDRNESSSYHIPKVPPVNDLHPPVVSGPKSRAEVSWMLQPPPIAKVMAGKERPGRPPSILREPIDYRSKQIKDQPEKEHGQLLSLSDDDLPEGHRSHPSNTALKTGKPLRSVPPEFADSFPRHPARTLMAGQSPGTYNSQPDSPTSTTSGMTTPTKYNSVDVGELIQSLSSHPVANINDLGDISSNMSAEAIEMKLRKIRPNDHHIITALEQFDSDRPPCRWSIDF